MGNARYCGKCGKPQPGDNIFCSACGASLSWLDSPTQAPTSETGRLPAGKLLHQRYRLLHTIGQGGMGAVYVAQDAQLGDRLVAVKEMSMRRLHPTEIQPAVERFKQEAHLLARLQHSHLPVIHEYFDEDGRWYLVMSFIQGETLGAHLLRFSRERLPIPEVIRIGIELCDVLDYLHTHQPQIIFRDLKPQNIMITPKGEIYLIDFGIARHFKQDQTQDTHYYYSVGYAPPEQYGQSQTGPRSDIYSLGATLHQMLTGHNPISRPFHFPDPQLLAPDTPVRLAQLLSQMLDLNEEKRPASVAEVRTRLEDMLKPSQLTQTENALAARTEKTELAQTHQARPALPDNQAEQIKAATQIEPALPDDQAEQIETATQAEPTLPDDEAKQTKPTVLAGQASSVQAGPATTDLRVLFWICFIGGSLVFGALEAYRCQLYGINDFYGYEVASYVITGIGCALIGVVQLAAKKSRDTINICTGIALIVPSYLPIIGIENFTIAYSGNSYSKDGYLTIVFCAFLLLVGIGFLLRYAGPATGETMGALFIIAGIILAVVAFNLIYNYNTNNEGEIPYLLPVIYTLQTFLGLTLLIVARLRRPIS